jgi:hypothetical protein
MSFTVRAGYSSSIDLKTSVERAREFFANASNFVDLMPGVRQIHVDGQGIAHWQVEVELPVVGKIVQRFALELGEHTEDRVEWLPAKAEAENLLRYSAEFLEKAKNATHVHFSQLVELRRKKASDLHYLASLAGESLISSEMTKRVTKMIATFIERAKERLEQ